MVCRMRQHARKQVSTNLCFPCIHLVTQKAAQNVTPAFFTFGVICVTILYIQRFTLVPEVFFSLGATPLASEKTSGIQGIKGYKSTVACSRWGKSTRDEGRWHFLGPCSPDSFTPDRIALRRSRARPKGEPARGYESSAPKLRALRNHSRCY